MYKVVNLVFFLTTSICCIIQLLIIMIFLRQMIKKKTYNHIIKHIEAFIKIKDDKKEFILVSFVDAPREQDHYYSYVKIHLEEFCNKYLPNYKPHVIIEFNFKEERIAGLWYTYLFLKSQNVDDVSYIAHFERLWSYR